MQKQEEETNSQDIDNILFGTLYRRKISIKDWLYTKIGFFILTILAYLFFANKLDGIAIAGTLVVSLFFYNREKSFAYEKENTVWLIKAKKFFFNELDRCYKKQLEKKSNFTEATAILKDCEK